MALVVQLAGQDATAADAYTYLDDGTRPALTGLEPDHGPDLGRDGGDADRLGPGRGHGGDVRRRPRPELTVNPEGTRMTVTTPAGPVGEAPVVTVTFSTGAEVRAAGPSRTRPPARRRRRPRASPRRSGAGLLAQTGLPLLAVALVGTALAAAGHLLRSRR